MTDRLVTETTLTGRVLLIFLDGVGVGNADAAINPFAAAPPRTITALVERGDAVLMPLDATLDTPGLPQSGTGQYSLFTGDNGAARFGRHHGPWVPTMLRQPLMERNLLTHAGRHGRRIAFANAYPEALMAAAHRSGDFQPIGPLRAGVPLAACGARPLTRHVEALRDGESVASEIIHDGWRTHIDPTLPKISPRQAGQNLGRLAMRHDLTLFAHYTTDKAGHAQSLPAAIAALALVDELIAGALDAVTSDTTVLIVSDHGNLEDVRTGHTRNPAFGLAIGPHRDALASAVSSLTDVADATLGVLGIRSLAADADLPTVER